jgi:cell division protein FtsI/penicillin-binding protein 2
MTLGVGALALRPVHRDPGWPASLASLGPTLDGAQLTPPLDDDGRAELTLDPELQSLAERLLVDADAARGAAVVLSVADGRILTLAGRARAAGEKQPLGNSDPQLALSAWAPAASVFKLVTTAALLDRGVAPETRVCFHGGLHSVEADNLEHHPRLDRTCRDLSYGLARSQNAILARLAAEHLDPDSLTAMARAFGFGTMPDAQLPVAPSLVSVPIEPLAFARVAAGFWQTTLSPLHGALIAALIARGGTPVAAHIVEREGDGALVPLTDAIAPQAIAPAVARTLGAMMVNTTEWGSARAAFHERRGRHYRRALEWRVAGKTGSLFGERPFVAYTWFVGFAPAEQPQIAFAVLLGHDQENRVKAAELARRLVGAYAQRTPLSPFLARR